MLSLIQPKFTLHIYKMIWLIQILNINLGILIFIK